MQRLVIRHAESEGNIANRIAFGQDGAPLTEFGKSQARALGEELRKAGIDIDNEPVAVSPKIRAQQTAKEAGFKSIVINPLLDEVKSNLNLETYHPSTNSW